MAGATQQTFNPTAGINYAVIIDYNSCIDTTACINLSSASVLETSLASLSVYPNPSNASAQVLGDLDKIEGITIYSTDGKIQLSTTGVMNSGTINGSENLNPGVYLIEIQVKDKKSQIRWVNV